MVRSRQQKINSLFETEGFPETKTKGKRWMHWFNVWINKDFSLSE